MTTIFEHYGVGFLPTVEFIESVLARLTYKETWRFEVERTQNGSWVDLRLIAYSDEPDSRTNEPRDDFFRTHRIDWPCYWEPTEATVLAWVRKAIQEWEVHEMNEWLRLDGEIIHDPHECPQCRVGGCRG